MTVDKTYSDTQGPSPNQSHEKFEWHILLTEKSITEKNVTEQEKCTAIQCYIMLYNEIYIYIYIYIYITRNHKDELYKRI